MAAHPDHTEILAAAAEWRDSCLRRDGSVLSDRQLWTSANLDELNRFFVQNLDMGTGTFFSKLEAQLAPTSPTAKQLAAEMLWILYLFPNNIGRETKVAQIRMVWQWSGDPFPASAPILAKMHEGIGSGGTGYNNFRWAELVFLAFLERVSALEQRNLALEMLRKLLTDQIKISERTNLVQAQKFREALEKALLGYTNKQVTTAQMIAQLLDLAKWVREAKRHGEELGLSDEETAFYDALAENGSAKEVMKSEQLRLMARELAEMVKKMPKLDWTQRESVRADLRRKVRRLLAMYGYPPDLSEDATQLVLRQAELSTEYAE